MKVKCINNKDLPWGGNLTVGKVYEVLENLSNDHIRVQNDNGVCTGYWNRRLEEVVPTLKEQLESAKLRVSEIEAQIEAQKPKIGQKYRHKRGDTYFLAKVNNGYVLISIEGENQFGYNYCSPTASIEGAFGGCKEFFTLI